jgi:hypothetical protein
VPIKACHSFTEKLQQAVSALRTARTRRSSDGHGVVKQGPNGTDAFDGANRLPVNGETRRNADTAVQLALDKQQSTGQTDTNAAGQRLNGEPAHVSDKVDVIRSQSLPGHEILSMKTVLAMRRTGVIAPLKL